MKRSFHLGVDIGRSRVQAATARATLSGDLAVVTLPLSTATDDSPAVVFVTEEGHVLFGESAAQRGAAEPERLVSDILGSVGSDVPVVVGGHVLTAASLLARIVEWVIGIATACEEADPESVTVAHPAAWGPYRVAVLRSALAELGLTSVVLVADPLAAAHEFDANQTLPRGASLALFDLGGTAFRFSVIRKEDDGDLHLSLALPDLEGVGGGSLDDAVVSHVLRSTSRERTADARAALMEARRDCVLAKEALSAHPQTVVPAQPPVLDTSVRLTRSELESLVDPALDRVVATAAEALDHLGFDPEEIMLVGGSSRIPRVSQRLSASFDRPIDQLAEPASAIARGAARTGLLRAQAAAVAAGPTVAGADGPTVAGADDVAASALGSTATRTPSRALRRRAWAAVASVGTLLLVTFVALANTLSANLPPGSTDPLDPAQLTTRQGSVFDALPALVSGLTPPPPASAAGQRAAAALSVAPGVSAAPVPSVKPSASATTALPARPSTSVPAPSVATQPPADGSSPDPSAPPQPPASPPPSASQEPEPSVPPPPQPEPDPAPEPSPPPDPEPPVAPDPTPSDTPSPEAAPLAAPSSIAE